MIDEPLSDAAVARIRGYFAADTVEEILCGAFRKGLLSHDELARALVILEEEKTSSGQDPAPESPSLRSILHRVFPEDPSRLEEIERLGREEMSGVEGLSDASPSPSDVTRISPAGMPDDAARAAVDPPNVIGKYVKVSLLGRGGMGEVWKCWDTHLTRYVALKFLKGDEPEQIARFQREARMTAHLSHPNIASVYEVGKENGLSYIAMMFIDGQTLAAIPRRNPRKLVELMVKAAEAVHYANENGVIHRDLKPLNIMVDRSGHLTVMDFGLAKSTAPHTSLSTSFSVLGTPSYMAPEQAKGESHRVTPPADVYGLGATLYQLLSDRPPFKGKDPLDVLRQVVEEDPLPLRKISSHTDVDLETIVLKCLEKDPSQRYESALALRDDLTRWLKGEPILARPPSVSYRIRKFVRRHRLYVGLAAALFLSAGIASVAVPGWWTKSTESERATRELVLQKERAKARDVALKQLGQLRLEAAVIREWRRELFRTPTEIRVAWMKEVDKVSGFIAQHPDLPQALYVRALAWLNLGELTHAESDLEQSLKVDSGFSPAFALMARVKLERFRLMRPAMSHEDPEAVKRFEESSLAGVGEALQRGRSKGPDFSVRNWGLAPTPDDDVNETIMRALEEKLLRKNSEAALRILREAHQNAKSEEYCVWIGTWSPSSEEALRWLDEAIYIAPHYGRAYLARGNAREEAGDLDGAVEDNRKALAINPESSWVYNNLGNALRKRGELDLALDALDKAVQLDPTSAIVYNSRGVARRQKGDFDGALEDLKRALKLNPRNPLTYVNRANAYHDKKEYILAIQDAEKSMELDPKFAGAYLTRGVIKRTMNNIEGAIKDYDRVLNLDPRSPRAYHNRAIAWAHLKEYDKAIKDFASSLKHRPNHINTLVQRGLVRVDMNDRPGALKDFEHVIAIAPHRGVGYTNRGSLRKDAGDREGALKDFTMAIRCEDGRAPEAYANRAGIHLDSGNLDAAIEDYKKALQVSSKAWEGRKSVEKTLLDLQRRKGP